MARSRKKTEDLSNTPIVPHHIDTGAKIVGGRGRTQIRPVTILSTGVKTPEPKGVEVHAKPR